MPAAVVGTAARKPNRRTRKLWKQLSTWHSRRSSAMNRRKLPHGFLVVRRKTRDAAVLRRLVARAPIPPTAPAGRYDSRRRSVVLSQDEARRRFVRLLDQGGGGPCPS